MYFTEISALPLLTSCQEKNLAKILANGRKASAYLPFNDKEEFSNDDLAEIRKNGEKARKILVMCNTRLAVSQAARHRNRGVPFLDLIQEGNIGLIRGVGKYNPDRGFKLSTYVTWWIRQAITRSIRDKSRGVRLPVHVGDKVSKMRSLEIQYLQEFGQLPTTEELAEMMQVNEKRIIQWQRISQPTVSLNTPLDEEDGDGLELGDLIPDPKGSPEDQIRTSIRDQALYKAIEKLNPRERLVLILRYGLESGEGMTLEEVGQKMGVTRERVRQIESKALSRLRNPALRRQVADA